jgi:hypothetical protein
MVGKPLRVNWDASAELFWQAKRPSKRKGKPRPSTRCILTAPLYECVRQVVARSPDERPQYSIKVSGEAGIGKTSLDYRDVEALAWRVDYPENP